MTFDSFELLIHPSDSQLAIATRKMVSQFGEGLAANGYKNYSLAFGCRIRYSDGGYYRTLQGYPFYIFGVEHEGQQLLLQHHHKSIRQCD